MEKRIIILVALPYVESLSVLKTIEYGGYKVYYNSDIDTLDIEKVLDNDDFVCLHCTPECFFDIYEVVQNKGLSSFKVYINQRKSEYMAITGNENIPYQINEVWFDEELVSEIKANVDVVYQSGEFTSGNVVLWSDLSPLKIVVGGPMPNPSEITIISLIKDYRREPRIFENPDYTLRVISQVVSAIDVKGYLPIIFFNFPDDTDSEELGYALNFIDELVRALAFYHPNIIIDDRVE